MDRRNFLKSTGAVLAGLSLTSFSKAHEILFANLQTDSQGRKFGEGYVFEDKNGNGRRDPGELGIANVCVSNGREVVKTDKNGKWQLPIYEDCVIFVVKPSGYAVPVGPTQLPQFFYVHKPTGSPKQRYPGVAPTGELPKSIDFALTKSAESDKFCAILFGDPQPRNQNEVDFMSHDLIEQCAKEAKAIGAKFGISLGDEMFDVLSLYDSLNGSISTIGIPWYNTVGNHDMNFDAPDDTHSTETYIRTFGPTYHSFNYGKVHVIVLDDVIWDGAEKKSYHGEISKKQLEWVANDLKFVPKDHLLLIAMHIPLAGVDNREELYRLIEDRPHTLSLSAHTHIQRHFFYGEANGWRGKNPHHHFNNVTVCGSWWRGAPDERGIPHATMSDGVPNGYSIITFDGNKYKIEFRPASRPVDDQMSIFVPEVIERAKAAETEVIVNVFAGSIKSKTEMRIGSGDWTPMTQFSGQDPFYLRLKEIEAGPNPPPGMKLPGASTTDHLWKANLPEMPPRGTHSIEIRTTDQFGHVYTDRRIVRVK